MSSIPLALYIHFPWCTSKCPYCDFNSHAMAGTDLPEQGYIEALVADLRQDRSLVQGRELVSIFMGGGTPSLFSGEMIARLLRVIKDEMTWAKHIEITLEANPESLTYEKLRAYRAAGVNRISIGVQSMQTDKLRALGRAHDNNQAMAAIVATQKAGFTRYNVDLMYGLPKQTLDDALFDLQSVCEWGVPHVSWYHLTLEPNTVFYNQPPRQLPKEDDLFILETAGREYLQSQGYAHYEISAYGKPRQACVHNTNYWQFGDYLGIGAGAHSKITDLKTGAVKRFNKWRTPQKYLDKNIDFISNTRVLNSQDLTLEFMMNALRLTHGVPYALFEQHTGLSVQSIAPAITELKAQALLTDCDQALKLTAKGQLFLDSVLQSFT